jgi:hypothetical protein
MVKPKDPPRKTGSTKARKTNSPFNLWLERSLHQMFDDVAREPVPEDLLKLIKADGKKDGER